jgi:hypothetical protein
MDKKVHNSSSATLVLGRTPPPHEHVDAISEVEKVVQLMPAAEAREQQSASHELDKALNSPRGNSGSAGSSHAPHQQTRDRQLVERDSRPAQASERRVCESARLPLDRGDERQLAHAARPLRQSGGAAPASTAHTRQDAQV